MSSAWVGDVLVVQAGHATTTVVVYMSSNRHTTHATRSARQLAVRWCVQATPGCTATPAVALPTPPECGGMRTPNVNTEESTLERTKPTILCSWTTQQPQKSRVQSDRPDDTPQEANGGYVAGRAASKHRDLLWSVAASVSEGCFIVFPGTCRFPSGVSMSTEGDSVLEIAERFWNGAVVKDAVSPMHAANHSLHEFRPGLAFFMTFANVVVVDTDDGMSRGHGVPTPSLCLCVCAWVMITPSHCQGLCWWTAVLSSSR